MKQFFFSHRIGMKNRSVFTLKLDRKPPVLTRTRYKSSHVATYPRPSMEQATPASTLPNESSQTVPHFPATLTSKRPSRARWLPARRMSTTTNVCNALVSGFIHIIKTFTLYTLFKHAWTHDAVFYSAKHSIATQAVTEKM